MVPFRSETDQQTNKGQAESLPNCNEYTDYSNIRTNIELYFLHFIYTSFIIIVIIIIIIIINYHYYYYYYYHYYYFMCI